jgi:hypothetical protein
MNIVAIDPSLVSTAVVVNGKIYNYCRESDATTKSGLSKWFKLSEPYCNYEYISYTKFKTYSEGESCKIRDYDRITSKIINDIKSNLNPDEETWVLSEGYNFGAQVGDLVDLVTFSTLLRKKIIDYISTNLTIISPSSLKLETCKLTYKPIEKEVGKKKKRIEIEYRNNQGVSGGKLTKVDMARAIIDNQDINHSWFTYIKSIQNDILSQKDIKKPLEDINDAILLYFIAKSGNISM